jgi:hypothetical protein
VVVVAAVVWAALPGSPARALARVLARVLVELLPSATLP